MNAVLVPYLLGHVCSGMEMNTESYDNNIIHYQSNE